MRPHNTQPRLSAKLTASSSTGASFSLPKSSNGETVSATRHSRNGTKPGGSRVSVACTACRSQHLRCDATQPICSRCRVSDRKCTYVSLRGRGKRGVAFAKPAHMSRSNAAAISQDLPTAAALSAGLDEIRQDQDNMLAVQDFDPALESLMYLEDVSTVDEPHTQSLDGYYAHFHQGHPFVLPQPQLELQMAMNPNSVSSLLSVMRFIGSLYISDPHAPEYRRQADQAIFSEGPLPRNGFSVQFLLLFAIALEWSTETDTALQVLNTAKEIALEIGLHQRDFASRCGQGNPVMEESWRRTWWELYVIDAFFAGIRSLPTFSLWKLDFGVDLPCEEQHYTSGDIPPPRTMVQFDNRAFLEDEIVFSSLAYLIDTARILGMMLATLDPSADSIGSLVKNTEANILSWELHLPHSKRDPVGKDGTVDEIMFQALMLINTVSIHLHRPRSKLLDCSMEIIFAKYASPIHHYQTPASEQQHDRHTFKALGAANRSTDLFSLPAPLHTHSPFVMCMGALATVAQISACEHVLRPRGVDGSSGGRNRGEKHEEDDEAEFRAARDRVRVFLGVLRQFEKIWPQASQWLYEIRTMARPVFEGGGAMMMMLRGDEEVTAAVATATTSATATASFADPFLPLARAGGGDALVLSTGNACDDFGF